MKGKKRHNSNSKESRKTIWSEIRAFFNPREYGVRSTLSAVKKDAEAAKSSLPRVQQGSDYHKGRNLVDGGSLACYYDDQRKMLRKIYGRQVEDWSGNKVHNTYAHLIGREYDRAIRAEKAKKNKRKKG